MKNSCMNNMTRWVSFLFAPKLETWSGICFVIWTPMSVEFWFEIPPPCFSNVSHLYKTCRFVCLLVMYDSTLATLNRAGSLMAVRFILFSFCLLSQVDKWLVFLHSGFMAVDYFCIIVSWFFSAFDEVLMICTHLLLASLTELSACLH